MLGSGVQGGRPFDANVGCVHPTISGSAKLAFCAGARVAQLVEQQVTDPGGSRFKSELWSRKWVQLYPYSVIEMAVLPL